MKNRARKQAELLLSHRKFALAYARGCSNQKKLKFLQNRAEVVKSAQSW
jgi:hypothetical protein